MIVYQVNHKKGYVQFRDLIEAKSYAEELGDAFVDITEHEKPDPNPSMVNNGALLPFVSVKTENGGTARIKVSQMSMNVGGIEKSFGAEVAKTSKEVYTSYDVHTKKPPE